MTLTDAILLLILTACGLALLVYLMQVNARVLADKGR